MPQTSGRLFDEFGKLLTDAAGAAHGERKEIEAVVRGRAERMLRDLDVVQREELEAVKALTQAREENARLQERVRMLEIIVADAKDPAFRSDTCPETDLAEARQTRANKIPLGPLGRDRNAP